LTRAKLLNSFKPRLVRHLQSILARRKKTNAVKVIDPKRANNGGIVLTRLKITHGEMAVAIDTINDKVMNI